MSLKWRCAGLASAALLLLGSAACATKGDIERLEQKIDQVAARVEARAAAAEERARAAEREAQGAAARAEKAADVAAGAARTSEQIFKKTVEK
jgi:hypothetical protein